MGACLPGNELRNAGRQENRKREKTPAVSLLFLPSCIPAFLITHPESPPDAIVLLREFEFRVTARQVNPQFKFLILQIDILRGAQGNRR
jgi:hypothetical protein